MTRTETNRRQYKKLSVLNWIYCLAVSAAAVVIVFTLWFTGIKVADDGMSPALYQGDIILFNKLSKHISSPERGDIYAFKTEDGTSVGRIVALPGDTADIHEGKVYINGSLLNESVTVESQWEAKAISVPDGSFLILPDDRSGALPQSQDMIISFEDLTGKAAVRVSPIGMAAFFVNN